MNTETPNTEVVTESEQKPTQSRLVIIHDTDADGIAAAWCIKQGFSGEHSETVCIPQRAGINDIPEGLLPDDTVYLVDRTYPWVTLVELSKLVFQVTVIDHHKSAKEQLYKDAVQSGLYELEFYNNVDGNGIDGARTYLHITYANLVVAVDVDNSACMLAWSYVRENATVHRTEPPWFISYIEDRDMWWFKLPFSKEINAGLHFKGHTFENYHKWLANQLYWSNNTDKEHCISVGSIVLATQQRIIEGIAHGPTVSWWMLKNPVIPHQEYLTAMVCCPFSLISDLGNYMLTCDKEGYEKPDVVLVYNWDVVKKCYIYSIRSVVDMLWLAQLYGGGGHPKACRFSTEGVEPLKELVAELLTYTINNVPNKLSTTH
jgi:oligoribonuclease NrnB/cAMP/cGMP phosphodiesterase (DHH superfamily)